jgi:hypothetical protein
VTDFLPLRQQRGDGGAARLPSGLLAGIAAAAILAATIPARAADGGVAVNDPWMRAVIPSRPAAGYFTLLNGTDTAKALVGAQSPACGMLMLHQSRSENGNETMSMVDSVAIPPHGKVSFAPGGYHLMCMSPSPEVSRGHSIPVTLRFGDGSTLSANFPVRGPNEK